jgi:ABC-2 type transport system permease protein
MIVPLVQNETLKILRRKRFAVVVAILFAIIALVTYSQARRLREQRNRNWRAEIQQVVAGYQNTLRRGRIGETWARSLRAEINRLQFYLDLVSAENAEGTDKLLLTRPVRRWKVLTSKLLTLWMFATLTLISGALLAYSVSAPFLPRGGWAAPTFTGFSVAKGAIQIDAVRQLPMWKDTLIAYGLDWFALLTVACIALLLSVLFKSSAAAIGTMLASLIGGTILTRISPDWTAGKYLFVSALPLADYYTGEPPPYDGMSMLFCMGLLGAWAIVATAISYIVFTRRDVFG